MKDYKKFFNNEKIEMLSEQHDESYVIDLMKDKKSSFMFLYNLTQNELIKLRRYFNDVLIKKWIKHFILSTKISIFFIFKKDEKFRLCVNYRSLNVVIVKNRHLLSLITKTLNHFLMILSDSQNLILKMFIIEFASSATMNKKQRFTRVMNISNIK